MSTSGSYNLNHTLNELLEEAFDLLQVGADGETLTADMLKRGKRSLNLMLKEWEAQGLHLWTKEEGSLFLAVGTEQYDFTSASTHLANTYYETTLSAAEASGQTELSVTSTTNMTVTDPIGIILDNNDLHWSTVASKTATTVTINDALTRAAASGAAVYNYRLNDFKPAIRVISTRRKDASNEIPMLFESRGDYFNLPNKTQTGTPVMSYYARKEPMGIMYVWPAPDSAIPVINFSYERKIQIMNSGSDTFDMPEYWFNALAYNASVELIPKYGCSLARATLLKAAAKEKLDLALGFDSSRYPIDVEVVHA